MPERYEDTGLVFQALLYLTGDGTDPAAAAFEERLSGDPQAQAALCRAVELVQATSQSAPSKPNPSYRRRVQRRLAPRPRRRGMGAFVLSLVLLLLVAGLEVRTPDPSSRVVIAPVPGRDEEEELPLEVALDWAELSNLEGSHLARLHRPAAAGLADGEEEESGANLHDSTHLAQAHEEYLRRLSDGQRKGRTASRGSQVPPR